MDLSILIPARNEMFLAATIRDILENIEADTEIIAVLDGEWADPPIEDNPRVNLIYVPVAMGQRAAQNMACKLAQGKYVMKVDAHCSFDKGFDRKMIEAFGVVGDNVTIVPTMKNLHAFSWKCYKCGWLSYQGARPKECPVCGVNGKIRMKMEWRPRRGTHSTSYKFDSEPKFGYFNDYTTRPEYQEGLKTGLTESMSLQGSCFMSTRENYWKLGLCDEKLGNWGNQGIEVACATWFSGGRVLVNHNTWYAHLFRTRTDFGFPWPVSGSDQGRVKKNVKDKYWNNPKLKWLVEKFMPIPGWGLEDIAKLDDK